MALFLQAQTRVFSLTSKCQSARRAQIVRIVPDWRMPAYRQICRGSAISDPLRCEKPWPDRNRLFLPPESRSYGARVFSFAWIEFDRHLQLRGHPYVQASGSLALSHDELGRVFLRRRGLR